MTVIPGCLVKGQFWSNVQEQLPSFRVVHAEDDLLQEPGIPTLDAAVVLKPGQLDQAHQRLHPRVKALPWLLDPRIEVVPIDVVVLSLPGKQTW